jgi:hypothetical protein
LSTRSVKVPSAEDVLGGDARSLVRSDSLLGCQVRDDCYADVMENRWRPSGVWAGTSRIQRRKMSTNVA